MELLLYQQSYCSYASSSDLLVRASSFIFFLLSNSYQNILMRFSRDWQLCRLPFAIFCSGYICIINMSLEEQVERQIQQVISRTHQLLSDNFTFLSESRDLDARENQLLLELDQNSLKYTQLAGALAIESYSEHIIQLISGCQPLLEVTALIFGNLSQARSWSLQAGTSDLSEVLEDAWLNLGKLAEITHKMFPRSPLVKVHQSFLEEAGSDPSDTIYGRLYEQNIELKQKLEKNDRQVLQLQLKLTKLLQEHDGCDGNIDSSLKFLELRQELAAKNEEIERMNEEFAVQIQKYNTVYEAMKREIEDLKDYKEVDLIEMVERLQTEIVKLREEKERDDIIIRELRQSRFGLTGSPNIRKPTSYSRVYY